jgi:hypothetical protein
MKSSLLLLLLCTTLSFAEERTVSTSPDKRFRIQRAG